MSETLTEPILFVETEGLPLTPGNSQVVAGQISNPNQESVPRSNESRNAVGKNIDDDPLTPLVEANAGALVICPWMNNEVVTMSAAVLAYSRTVELITDDNIHAVAALMNSLPRAVEIKQPEKNEAEKEPKEEIKEEADEENNAKQKTRVRQDQKKPGQDTSSERLKKETNKSHRTKQPIVEPKTNDGPKTASQLAVETTAARNITQTVTERTGHMDAEPESAFKTPEKPPSNVGSKPEPVLTRDREAESRVEVLAIESKEPELGAKAEQLDEPSYAEEAEAGLVEQAPTEIEVYDLAGLNIEDESDNSEVEKDRFSVVLMPAGGVDRPEALETEALKFKDIETQEDDVELEQTQEPENVLAPEILDYKTEAPEGLTELAEGEVIFLNSIRGSFELLPEESFPPEGEPEDLPAGAVEASLSALVEQILTDDPETGGALSEILDKKIIEVPDKFERQADEETFSQEQAREELEELIRKFFDAAGKNYTPELVETLVNLMLRQQYLKQVEKSKAAKAAGDAPHEVGTHEAIIKPIFGSDRPQEMLAQIYAIGSSALWLYQFKSAA